MNNHENETSYYCGNCGTYNLYGSCSNCEWQPNYDYFDFDEVTNNNYDNNVFNADGFNINGYDINGYDENGYDSQGYDRSGHTIEYYQDEDESDSEHEFDEDGNDLTWMNHISGLDSTRLTAPAA